MEVVIGGLIGKNDVLVVCVLVYYENVDSFYMNMV